MKRLINAFLSAFGAKPSAEPAAKPETVPLKSLRYSMPTVAADAIDFEIPTEESFRNAPQFHEDEWCQLEFFPSSRREEIQKLLTEYSAFERAHRLEHGWKELFVRKIARRPVAPPETSPVTLCERVAGRLLPAPILCTTSQPLGQVRDGFSIELGSNAFLYGILTDAGITVLAADLAGADDMLLTQAFVTLHTAYDLILVDWRQQFVLISVNENQSIGIWRP
jgi:hypothetical protein